MADKAPPVTTEQIEQAASRLRPREREALRLSVVLQLTSGEIGERLGISADAAEALVARALLGLEWALCRQERPWWRFW